MTFAAPWPDAALEAVAVTPDARARFVAPAAVTTIVTESVEVVPPEVTVSLKT